MALIEYDEYKQRLRDLGPELEKLSAALDMDSARAEARKLEDETAQDGFWNDLERYQKVQQRLKQLQNKIARQDKLVTEWQDLTALCEMGQEAEDEELLEELKSGFQTLEEKMALLEKSYELAARYNGKEPDASSTANAPNSRKERTAVRPVKRVQNRMVSSLAQPAGNEDIASGYAGERNTGFHTPVGKMPSSGRNTIAACVHGTQTVSDGQALRIRLLEPMAVDDLLIPKGTVLVGGTRVEGERMGILIETVEYRGTLFPVELEVYDADGQQGILVPNSMEYDAAREIAAGMGTSIGSSINISTDAGAQIASDVGKGVIQGMSQYVGKKMRTVKITLKAGHRLLLHSPEK